MRRGGRKRINQSDVLPTQPTRSPVRTKTPRVEYSRARSLRARTLTLLVNRASLLLSRPTRIHSRRTEVRAIYHRRGKSARHRPYQNPDDSVRRLSTVSPLSERRESSRTDFATKRDERTLLFGCLRPPALVLLGINGDNDNRMSPLQKLLFCCVRKYVYRLTEYRVCLSSTYMWNKSRVSYRFIATTRRSCRARRG